MDNDRDSDSPSLPPTLRERNKQDKSRRIREAAKDLFVTQGFEATTTKQVAERAGVGTGTLFLYAKDKQELVFLIFRDEIDQVIEAAFAKELRGRPLLDAVVDIFGEFFTYYHKHPELSRLFVKEMIFLQGAKQAEYAGYTLRFFARIADLVEAAKERGEVRPEVVSMRAASNFFAAYLFYLVSWLSQGAREPALILVELREALALQMQGLVLQTQDPR